MSETKKLFCERGCEDTSFSTPNSRAVHYNRFHKDWKNPEIERANLAKMRRNEQESPSKNSDQVDEPKRKRGRPKKVKKEEDQEPASSSKYETPQKNETEIIDKQKIKDKSET